MHTVKRAPSLESRRRRVRQIIEERRGVNSTDYIPALRQINNSNASLKMKRSTDKIKATIEKIRMDQQQEKQIHYLNQAISGDNLREIKKFNRASPSQSETVITEPSKLQYSNIVINDTLMDYFKLKETIFSKNIQNEEFSFFKIVSKEEKNLRLRV